CIFALQLLQHGFTECLQIGVGEIPDKYSEEQLADLFANAARRAEEGKFDDAVARLYRAVELLAQFFLARKGIDAGDIDLESLPLNLREKYSQMKDPKGKIKIAQERGYILLEEMGEELGQAFLESKRLRNALKSRNDSILAHGLTPISSDDYQKLAEEVTKLAFVFLPALEKLKTEAEFAHLKFS
ncbi:MAG: TIGR02710 family CRISPR-associated CARF protein, partial [bacterium]|nr:TIGR02710 family CRISPR-associated CARF protein [bacterium]